MEIIAENCVYCGSCKYGYWRGDCMHPKFRKEEKKRGWFHSKDDVFKTTFGKCKVINHNYQCKHYTEGEFSPWT